MRAPWKAAAIAPIVVVGALALAGCIPIPGSTVTVNACVGCINSQASTRSAPAPVAPEARPSELLADLAPALPATTTPEASPSEAAPTPAHLDPAPAPATEPAPAASGAGTDEDVAPVADEPPPDPADTFAARLREVEGLSLVPYPDTGGIYHICYGHRVTVADCDGLLVEDMTVAAEAAERVVGQPTWNGLTERRRWVLIEMSYMLGEGRLRKFEKMLTALRAGDYRAASIEITASLLRPPTRAASLAVAMLEG